MRIKFKSFSRRALGKYRPGQEADLPDQVAIMYLNKGYAEPVKPKAERAVLPAAETASVEPVVEPVVEPITEKAKKWWKKKRRK